MARARTRANGNGNGKHEPRRYFIADVEVTPERHARYQTFVRNVLSKMTDNALTMRTEWLQKRAGKDPRRDINKDCGYADDPSIEDYDELCRVEAIAERTATVWADETWQNYPSIYETQNEQDETEFEKALVDMEVGFLSPSGKTHCAEKKNARLMDVLHRADRAAGRGRYSVILIGLNDGQDLRKPVRGIKETNSGVQIDQQPVVPGRSGIEGGGPLYYNFSVNAERKKNKVKFLRVYPERYARVTRVETNLSSPRYGMPVEYQITEQDATNYGVGAAQERTRVVHWSRVMHVVTHPDEGNEVLGRPELRVPYRRIMDLQKLYGGSAEMYWLGAFGGIAFEAAADLLDAGTDMQEMRDEVELYMNGLQRFLRLIGVQAKTLAPTVSDPTAQIQAQLQAVAIYLKMPMRILMGSERGELASSQDDAAWNDRVKHRQMYVVIPRLIIPFLDHLITIGALPEPEEGYYVDWPDITSQTDEQKSLIAVNRTKAMTTYTSGGGAELMSPLDFLVKEMFFDPEEAEEMLESVQRAKRENMAEQALAGALSAMQAAEQGAQQPPPGGPPQPGQPPAPGAPPAKPGQPGAPPPQQPLPPKQPNQPPPKKAPAFNAFCPTGEGGGVDPTCSPGEQGGKVEFTVKPPKKLYRGVMESGQGAGVYSLGKGLYSTPSKKFLSGFKYDKVIELTPEEAFPRKPLVLRSASEFTDWLLRESKERNIRTFNEKWSDPGLFVQSKGYDGVWAGDEVVWYKAPQKKAKV